MSWNQEHSIPKAIYGTLFWSVPILLFIALVMRSPLIFGLAFLFTIFILVNHYYLKYVAEKTKVFDETEVIRMFPEDKRNITIPLENSGKIPIFNSEVSFIFYDYDHAVQVGNSETPQETYSFPLSISPLTQKKKNIEVTALKRGVATIRTIDVTVYDLLKLSKLELYYRDYFRREIIVYPTPKTVSGIDQVVQQRQGDIPRQRSLHEDMMMTMGTREYVSGDPFNRVHWKASARTTTLQTKLYEKTTILNWTIVINLYNKDRSQLTVKNLEDILSHVAFVCQFATKHNISFEIYINTRIPKSMFIHLPKGLGKDHLLKALELLARVSKYTVTTPAFAMLKLIKMRTTLTPFILHFGPTGEEEDVVYRDWKRSGASIYRVESSEDVGKVVLLGGSKNETMAN
ncbi:DUF58 domain-containing protein [Anaerobacillus alkaliphilus]|uniref:DUF58 domain-containing protein n=1 Tax=Anaerobacillus alkaliphilus TaxID=1548597 RepID=A0A4Q0VQ67_9BACI|nr:DUF58 domain-containing protein [Anaerobacillus alkaliphilus]RXI98636.1 DUF58 domain-containing protein [Anaerobacillus alkaliphilus]